MARTRTLTQLRAEVRDRADIENSLHITDAQITRYVNQSGAALHAMLVEADENHFASTATVTTVAGTAAYTVAASCYKILFAMVPETLSVDTRFKRLKRFTTADVDRIAGGVVDGWSNPPWYSAPGGTNRISFLPVPTSVFTVTVTYVPAFVDLSADSDTLDGYDGWEEWIVLDAAIKCMVKEESDPSALMAERDRVLERIKVQMRNNDLGSPVRVQDREEPRWHDEIRAGRMA